MANKSIQQRKIDFYDNSPIFYPFPKSDDDEFGIVG